MDKKDNIFVKLQIEKDTQSGGLTLGIYFDRNAPNFSTERNTISWSPTLEEIDFITETFEMISNCKSQYRQRDDNIKNNETPFHSPKKIEEPPTVKTESKIAKFEPFDTDDDAEENTFPPSTESEETEEKIFVQANEETIEEASKRKKGESVEEFVVDADEKTIIDKVLKEKIKNKK
jgi:hypothetical protein